MLINSLVQNPTVQAELVCAWYDAVRRQQGQIELIYRSKIPSKLDDTLRSVMSNKAKESDQESSLTQW
jgi:hypothetical protein